jgi:hypothetical protein
VIADVVVVPVEPDDEILAAVVHSVPILADSSSGDCSSILERNISDAILREMIVITSSAHMGKRLSINAGSAKGCLVAVSFRRADGKERGSGDRFVNSATEGVSRNRARPSRKLLRNGHDDARENLLEPPPLVDTFGDGRVLYTSRFRVSILEETFQQLLLDDEKSTKRYQHV